MNKKVMLEFPDGARRWGYATTEPTDGRAVITWGGEVLGPLGATVITNDAETADALRKAGYSTVSRNDAAVKIGVSFPPALAARVKDRAAQDKTSASQAVVSIVGAFFEGQLKGKNDSISGP